MICFGIPKILFMQFRALHWESYVPLVEVSKFQHMWSFFGRSHGYNLFLGITEFLIGILIVFNRTRLIGLLLGLGLSINILVLNIEFDVNFAISHTTQDLILIILLLSSYGSGLYKFFISNGGKFDNPIVASKSKLVRLFPYAFLILLSVSYFMFSFYTKSKYIVDENIVGSYNIKAITVNDSVMNISKGSLGKNPMMFIEHNNQFVLSIDDAIYLGRYILNGKNIRIYLDTPTKFGLTSLEGTLKNNGIIGKNDENRSFEIAFKRVNGDKDYLNDLYR